MVRMIERPVVVVPPVYELPMNYWRWCKLGEVRDIAVNVAKLGNANFPVTIPQLIRRFANLVRPNGPVGNQPGRKIFRFTLDTLTLQVEEVPDNLPFAEFNPPVDEETFVPEGWARDTLRMIRRGCYEVHDSPNVGVIGIRETDGNHYIERL